MKGLLLKDFYVFQKNCRLYLLLIAVFIAASAVNDESFYILYPYLFAGMIPVTLMSYDEQSKWNQYCGTLPYSKAQIVSGKYLIGLFAQITVLLLSGIVQTGKIVALGSSPDIYLLKMSIGLFASFVMPSIVLPFMFKLGVEKGRIAYILILVIIGGGFFCFISLIQSQALPIHFPSHFPLLTLCLIAIAIYAFSWYLSIIIYKGREDL